MNYGIQNIMIPSKIHNKYHIYNLEFNIFEWKNYKWFIFFYDASKIQLFW